jgi:sensor histidine kinase YesM
VPRSGGFWLRVTEEVPVFGQATGKANHAVRLYKEYTYVYYGFLLFIFFFFFFFLLLLLLFFFFSSCSFSINGYKLL